MSNILWLIVDEFTEISDSVSILVAEIVAIGASIMKIPMMQTMREFITTICLILSTYQLSILNSGIAMNSVLTRPQDSHEL